MALPLIFSSIAAGLLATAAMIVAIYLPRTWGGPTYDVLGALGSYRSGRLDARSLVRGALGFALVGVAFAVLYGLIVLALLGAGDAVPSLVVLGGAGLPADVNLFYALIGIVFGLGHGVIVSLLLTILVVEHHPLPRFRSRVPLVFTALLSHLVFGAVVTFFHSQFLQLLGAGG